MVQDAADVVAGQVGQTGVAVLIEEQRLAVLPQGLVGVHARTVVTGKRLRHEGGGLAELAGGALDDVLEGLQVIRSVQQGVELVVDLLLSTGADLVVEALELVLGGHEVLHHRIADLTGLVDRRDREVTTLDRGLVTQVRGAVEVGVLAAVPPALFGIDLVEGVVDVGGVLHLVEEVELRLQAEVTGVGDAGGCEILLGLTGDIARITGERLAGEGVMDEELDVQGLRLPERVDLRGRQVREKIHVGLVDGGEASDGGTVESQTVGDGVLIERGGGDCEVLFHTRDVGEPDVNELDVLVLDELRDLFGRLECHCGTPCSHGRHSLGFARRSAAVAESGKKLIFGMLPGRQSSVTDM